MNVSSLKSNTMSLQHLQGDDAKLVKPLEETSPIQQKTCRNGVSSKGK